MTRLQKTLLSILFGLSLSLSPCLSLSLSSLLWGKWTTMLWTAQWRGSCGRNWYLRPIAHQARELPTQVSDGGSGSSSSQALRCLQPIWSVITILWETESEAVPHRNWEIMFVVIAAKFGDNLSCSDGELIHHQNWRPVLEPLRNMVLRTPSFLYLLCMWALAINSLNLSDFHFLVCNMGIINPTTP